MRAWLGDLGGWLEPELRGLPAAEIDRLLDDAVAFLHAGVAAVATG